MDFDRATLKALFYDYPVGHLIQLIKEDKWNQFWNPFVGLLQWREKHFTSSEFEAWMRTIRTSTAESGKEEMDFPSSDLFRLLVRFSQKVLRYEHREPVVEFNQLFRWRDVSLCLGEDTLILPFLAAQLGEEELDHCAWPDVLNHNDESINRLFQDGVSEVHAHLHASGNVADLNWILVMNNPVKYDDYLQGFKMRGMQELPLVLTQDEKLYSLHNLCVLASCIRIKLFHALEDLANASADTFQDIFHILDDKMELSEYSKKISSEASVLRNESIYDYKKEKIDYALTEGSIDGAHKALPYACLAGERNLLFRFFRAWFHSSKGYEVLAPYVYLYLLIRIRFRREFVQTNDLQGFVNFANYQSRKKMQEPPSSPLAELRLVYALQSCMRTAYNDRIEVRVSPNELTKLNRIDFTSSILDYAQKDWENKEVNVVVHFLKGTPKKEMENELESMLKERNRLNKKYHLVGIDAAGSEFRARPEVFGSIFRSAKCRGIERATFHAGEDFYDLVDGLRTIDEAVLFLELTHGDRIGHALALGLDAESFYGCRHHTVAISKQVLLDNLVWIHHKSQEYNIILAPAIALFLQEKCFELFTNLFPNGQGISFDFFHYWNSLLLRSNDEQANSLLSPTGKAASCSHERCVLALQDKVAVEMNRWYHLNKSKDEEVCQCKFPIGFDALVAAVQQALIEELADKGIAIECNPSSNLKIGRFSKYEQHPIFRFCPVSPADAAMPHLNVSINTDDRGVFSTSLLNEYSLMALAMTKLKTKEGKRRWDNECIYAYLSKIIRNGKDQQFANYVS